MPKSQNKHYRNAEWCLSVVTDTQECTFRKDVVDFCLNMFSNSCHAEQMADCTIRGVFFVIYLNFDDVSLFNVLLRCLLICCGVALCVAGIQTNGCRKSLACLFTCRSKSRLLLGWRELTTSQRFNNGNDK